jgi:hypothetical protein
MKLYWKVKRDGKWQWVVANYKVEEPFDSDESAIVTLWAPEEHERCECKRCVPGTTDGEE